MNVYKSNDTYTVHSFANREEWLKKRISGIGGSDSSTLVGRNPYKSNLDLWLEKTGRKIDEFKGNSATEYGTNAEEHIRWLYALRSPYEVLYQDNVILQSKETEWRLYSPDGLLIDGERKGILEIKTTMIQNGSMLNQWKEQVPEHYYIQVLHGLLVTNFDFVVFVVEQRFAWNNEVRTLTYEFTREEVSEDLEWLKAEEEKAYQYYINDEQPPRKINF